MPTVYSSGQVRYVPPGKESDMESEAVRARARMPVTPPSRTEKVKQTLADYARILGLQLGVVSPRTPQERELAAFSGMAQNMVQPLTLPLLGMPVFWTSSPRMAATLTKSIVGLEPAIPLASSMVARSGPAEAVKDAVIYLEPAKQAVTKAIIEGNLRALPSPLGTAGHELAHLVQRLRGHPGTDIRIPEYPVAIVAQELDAWIAAVKSGLASPRYAGSMLGTYISGYLPKMLREEIIQNLGLAKKAEALADKPALLGQALINAAVKDPKRVMGVMANLHLRWHTPTTSATLHYTPQKVADIIRGLGEVPEFPKKAVEALQEVMRRVSAKGGAVTGPTDLSVLAGRDPMEILQALLSVMGGR